MATWGWEVCEEATEAWLIEDCTPTGGDETRIDLDISERKSGSYEETLGCLYTLHAKRDCGEFQTSCNIEGGGP